MPADKAYLAVIQWPDELDERERADAIAHATGLDAYQADLVNRRGTPQIVARLDAEAAERSAEYLHDRGATAVAVRQSAMRAAPQARRLKRLTAAEGAPEPMYACEFWREPPGGLRAADLFLLVRAHVRSNETRMQPNSLGPNPMVFGGLDMAAAAAIAGSGSATRTSHTSVAEVLDLWLTDRARLRIDAERFNFDVLGEGRGRTGRENLDGLLALLRRDAPRAIVDEGFQGFRCPPDLVRSHFIDAGGASVKRTSDMPAFDFYSTWSWLSWRALAGG